MRSCIPIVNAAVREIAVADFAFIAFWLLAVVLIAVCSYAIIWIFTHD